MARALHFTKGQGTGNDFVLFADPEGDSPLTPEQVVALCDRRFGIGADGVIRAVRSENLNRASFGRGGKVVTRVDSAGRDSLRHDPSAQWFMDYWNADGSVAEMCGNGIRVFVAYLLQAGLTELPAGGSLAVGTRAGVRDVQPSSAGFTVDLGRWRLEKDEASVTVAGVNVTRPGLRIDVGNPHTVIALATLEELAAANLLESPEVDPAPVEGTNVELVVPAEPLIDNGIGRIHMRVYERGSAETLSCGTGVAAAALATRHWVGPGAPNNWRVEVQGGVLNVRMFAAEDGEHVALSGPAHLTFTGTVDLA